MESRIDEVLQGKEDNYILPFLWQHGEDEKVIREEMARVYEAGIHAVCIEARPHPDFLGPKWWQDIDVIMDEARTRGMRVWILDDDHFPTGHAAGRVENSPVELHRIFLRERYIDAIGPLKKASFLIQPWSVDPPVFSYQDGPNLVAAIAARREATSDRLTGEMLDLSSQVKNQVLYWDIPEGYWRVFLIISTNKGGSGQRLNYINPLVGESTQILIDTIYEAFYNHYRDDFGQTFAGFFSDEPGFYNDKDTFSYESTLGKKEMDLPWRSDLLELLEGDFGPDYRKYLPLLWHDGGEVTSAVRFTYMNLVSELYAENFTNRVGDWCRAHQVEYIGHVIEDNGAHARLGCGAGHFFRALWGQDMSGLDVVLWQLMPGYDEGPFNMESGIADGEFYHYGLGKLGSSLGHIDPKKKGRTMCEVFGAYGWCEGLKLMKWMTDHLLVRGVNYFVPHAFSQAEFPDLDCPPHLYARGKNPQYRYYRELNVYTNRLSHLLSGGRHIACTAVLYHAEAEWSGRAMPFQKPVKALLQSQIDCDVLPGDALIALSEVKDEKLCINNETYSCLIVPYSEALPVALVSRLIELAEQGLPLLFVDGFPQFTSERSGAENWIERLSKSNKVQVVSLSMLATRIKEMCFYEIEVEGKQPYLRYFHVEQPDFQVYMFSNEHPYKKVETRVSIPGRGHGMVYDAFTNQTSKLDSFEQQGRIHFSLSLSPYESQIILIGPEIDPLLKDLPTGEHYEVNSQEIAIQGPWSVGTATAEQYPVFKPYQAVCSLDNMSKPDILPNFSGTFRYETEFEWDLGSKSILLDLGEAYEIVEVWVNDQRIGLRISPPYRFEIGKFIFSGKNRLVIEVTNTLVKSNPDFFSRYSQQEPSGLIGPVRLFYRIR